ncbi:hypothetical protein HDV05_006698 [Chytridiales sp. JEL 0842]|nr:hypothetical protein HDV05_006698 [Chytridiales sp. JEL 0842]
MDANYLKFSVGPLLHEAITTLLAHYEPSDSANNLDPVDFIGRYLINHDKVMPGIVESRAKDRELQRLKELALLKHRGTHYCG